MIKMKELVKESKQSLKESRFDANKLIKLLNKHSIKRAPAGSAEFFANGHTYSFDEEGIEAPYTVWGNG